MKVKFLGRAKKYGKWIPMEVSVPDNATVTDVCRDEVKRVFKSDYAEVQYVEKMNYHEQV